jgi:hypothetical protein
MKNTGKSSMKIEEAMLLIPQYELDTPERACNLIIDICTKWAAFWPTSQGWAPAEAASLMKQEIMDRQLCMAHALKRWHERLLQNEAPGELVMAWTNLGSVIEGALKIYMCVYYEDWLKDADAPISNGKKLSPDDTFFDRLIRFTLKKGLFHPKDTKLLETVRDQRNLIHPMKTGAVLDRPAFFGAVMQAAALVAQVEHRLPYPNWNDR